MLDMGSDDIGFEPHIEGKESVMHLLKTWQICGEGAKAIAEETLHVTLTVKFGMTSAVAMRQANPVQSIGFAEDSVVFRARRS